MISFSQVSQEAFNRIVSKIFCRQFSNSLSLKCTMIFRVSSEALPYCFILQGLTAQDKWRVLSEVASFVVSKVPSAKFVWCEKHFTQPLRQALTMDKYKLYFSGAMLKANAIIKLWEKVCTRHLQFTLFRGRTGCVAGDREQCTVLERALLAVKA